MWKTTDQIRDLLHRIDTRITQMEKRLMSALDNLRAQVERNTNVTDNGVKMIGR